MKSKLSIRRISLFLCFLLALMLSIDGLAASAWAANQVTVDGKKTVKMVTTYEGTATSYTRRGNDPFSIGYYVKNGMIIGKNSLLADKDATASDLDIDLVANGEAFSAVIAHGKGTDITLTGSITATDNGNGKLASDFSGIGALIIAHDYVKVKVNSMKIDTKGFLRAAFISSQYGQILVKDTTVKALGANPLTEAFDGYVNSANQNIMLSPPGCLGSRAVFGAATYLATTPPCR